MSEIRDCGTVRRNRDGIRNMLIRFTAEGWTQVEKDAAEDWILDTFDATCDSHEALRKQPQEAWEQINAIGQVVMEDDLTEAYDPRNVAGIVAHRLSTLREQLREAIDEIHTEQTDHEATRDYMREARRDNRRLRDKLVKYASHRSTCAIRQTDEDPCSCGLGSLAEIATEGDGG